MLHCILGYIHVIFLSKSDFVINLKIAASCHFGFHELLVGKSSIQMLLVSESIDFLKLFNHFRPVHSSLSICHSSLVSHFIYFDLDFFLVFFSWNEINRMILRFFARHFRVFYYCFLRTWAHLLTHFEFFSWSWLLFDFYWWIVDFWFFFCRIHTVKHVANIIPSSKFFPKIIVYWLGSL